MIIYIKLHSEKFMETMEFSDKLVDLDRLSDEITNMLRTDGYNKILLDVETNSKDNEDKLFRIEAYKKGVIWESRTQLPPIKLQIRGKPDHFLIAQQWSSVDSDTISGVILGSVGGTLYLIRTLRRRKLEKKYRNWLIQKIELLNKQT